MRKNTPPEVTVDSSRCDSDLQKALDRATQIKTFIAERKAHFEKHKDMIVMWAQAHRATRIDFINFYSSDNALCKSYSNEAALLVTMRIEFPERIKNTILKSSRLNKSFEALGLDGVVFHVNEWDIKGCVAAGTLRF